MLSFEFVETCFLYPISEAVIVYYKYTLFEHIYPFKIKSPVVEGIGCDIRFVFICLPSIGLVGNPPMVLINDLKDFMDESVLVFFIVSLKIFF